MKKLNFTQPHSGKEKILITGVNGFIGSALAVALSKKYNIAGIVRQSSRRGEAIERLKKANVILYEGDLRDYCGIEWIVRDFRPDYVLHLGAITPVSYSFQKPQEVGEVNYIGSINLLEAIKRNIPSIKKIIVSSTMEVYGVQKEKAFTEDLTPHPRAPYAVAKLAMEKFIEYLVDSYKMPIITLRQTNCIGRLDNDYFVAETIITQMLKNDKEIELGDPRPVRNFIHIEDLVKLYEKLLAYKKDDLFGEIFNTGPANGLKIEKLAEKIAKKLKWNGKINWYARELRPGEIFYLNSTNKKVSSKIGWKPEITLDKALDKCIKFWQDKIA